MDRDGSLLAGVGIATQLDPAVRSRMANLRTSMFGASAEPSRVGRFVVLETLGAGGMGVVYAAYDPRLDRKIALKLVKPELATSAGNVEARLLREAQAMARLSHPNVVQIHEVGAWEGRVFIAMELVTGRSLAAWLEQEPRGWRDVVHMFAEAGRGLAAAHAAGMVHRDFKPENVLVGDDGRIRVTDFGLARGGASVGEVGETWREPGDPLAEISDRMSTGTAAFAGTPRFMSPEQFLGEPATAASDQFSYCVALYMALHGVHPFEGDDRATLARAVITGKRREPARMRIPRKIHKALVRGLSRAPKGRFAGMGELLRAIEPHAAWQRLAPAALFLVTGAGLGGVFYEGDPCADAGSLVEGIWDGETRSMVQRAFVAGEQAGGAGQWSATASELDRYTGAITDLHTHTCRAHRSGRLSSELFDLRIDCLDRRLEVVRSLIGGLLTAGMAPRDVRAAVSRLEPVSSCEDIQGLRGKEAPPPEQILASRLLERELDQAYALELVGDVDASRRQVTRAIADAREQGYAPTIAEALFRLGRLAVHERDFGSAEAALLEARDMATSSRFDALVGKTWSWLIQARVLGGKPTEAADDWLQQAQSWQRRGATGLLERADLERARASVRDVRGDFIAAEAAFHRALSLRGEALGPEHVEVAIDRMNHANVLGVLGRVDESIASLEVALEAMIAKVGAEHGLVADVHYNLGAALLLRDDAGSRLAAEQHLARSNAIIAARRGGEAIELADGYIALAHAAQMRGDIGTAEERVATALRIYDRHFGHPDRVYALGLRGQLLFIQGRYDEALAAHVEARAVAAAAWGEASDLVGAADSNIGDVLRKQGDGGGASRRYEAAVVTMERALGVSSGQLIPALLGLGELRQELGDSCGAADMLARAIDVMKVVGDDDGEVAVAEGSLAEAHTGCVRASGDPS